MDFEVFNFTNRDCFSQHTILESEILVSYKSFFQIFVSKTRYSSISHNIFNNVLNNIFVKVSDKVSNVSNKIVKAK